LTAFAALLAGVSLLALPIATSAFWPLSTSHAANAGGETPLVHDSSLPLLEAAINSDPNPAKGDTGITLSDNSALMANSGPDGTIADLESSSPSGQIATYTVKEGDSISKIASNFNVSVNTILWANNLTTKSPIKAGMNLVILPVSGIQHTVAKGETLAGVAKKFGADSGDIASYNGLDAGAGLTAGDVLIIPGGELVGAPTKSTTKAATTKKTSIKQGGGLTSLQNPYKGGSGAEADGYYINPVPSAILTQNIHGWNGVDLGAPAGTPIRAAADGTVIVSRVGGWNGGYGNYVVISHDNGTQTLYSHLSTDSVSVGQSVSQGSAIGTVGRTGEATGNHLHFEVRGAKNPLSGCSLLSHCSI
jgi:LysM repeat protein